MSVVRTRGRCPACGGPAVVALTTPATVCCDVCGHVAHCEAPACRCEDTEHDDNGDLLAVHCPIHDEPLARVVMLSIPDMDHGDELGEAGA